MPKIAAEKKNHTKIRYEISQAIFKHFMKLHEQGGILSLFDNSQLSGIAKQATIAIMRSDKVNIILRRKK